MRIFSLFSPRTSMLGMAFLLLMSGCSSNQPVSRSSKPETRTIPAHQQNEVVEATPETFISKAREVWQQEQNAVARNQYLLDAATAWLNLGDTANAQAVLFSLEQVSLDSTAKARTNLLIAESYLADGQATPDELLALLKPLADNPQLRQQQLSLQAELYRRQKQWLEAANAYVQSETDGHKQVTTAWNWVNQTPPSVLKGADETYPALRPYLALYDLLASKGLSQRELRQAIIQFRQVYRGHPLVEYWPEEISKALSLEPKKPDRILVLLPLSGRLKPTGQTIKEGMLSSYYATLEKTGMADAIELNFVDTTGKDAQALIDIMQGYRWVIGPLLKENVDAIRHRIPAQTTLLALNRPDTDNEQKTVPQSPLALDALLPDALMTVQPRVYFSLAPEDEADQLAEFIFQNGYQAPIVVTAQGSIYQRMYDAFAQRWQTLNTHETSLSSHGLTTVTFTDSATLKDGITEALDVAQSRERIRQIEYMVNEKLYNVPRNRRDIDAIVVFASPEQTELLNPMVEASLSPFNGKTVPVFATSRSMAYDNSKNQWRDLQNVRFLEMPWMLPNNPWRTLKQQTSQLWPQQSTQMSRLFAFGVDAYALLPHLPSMALLPQTSIEGLTGTIRVNQSQQVIRQLPQAIINNQEIRTVVEPITVTEDSITVAD